MTLPVQQLLLDMQAKHEADVYHNDIRWLSWGFALQCFNSLREESDKFYQKGTTNARLSDPVWLSAFGFLVDITGHLNSLNTSPQGQNPVVSDLHSQIKAIWTKLLLFQRHLSQKQHNTPHFPLLQEIMTCFPQNNINVQMKRYATDISSLAEKLQQRLWDFTCFFSSFLRGPWWRSWPPAAGAYWAAMWCISLSSTFTASWVWTSSKRLRCLLRKCWACSAQHICTRWHSRLWTLTTTAWWGDKWTSSVSHLEHQTSFWARPDQYSEVKLSLSPFTLV